MVNVCEMKFSNGLYEISEDADLKLQTRMEAFANAVGNGKTIHLTMVTSRGLQTHIPGMSSRRSCWAICSIRSSIEMCETFM